MFGKQYIWGVPNANGNQPNQNNNTMNNPANSNTQTAPYQWQQQQPKPFNDNISASVSGKPPSWPSANTTGQTVQNGQQPTNTCAFNQQNQQKTGFQIPTQNNGVKPQISPPFPQPPQNQANQWKPQVQIPTNQQENPQQAPPSPFQAQQFQPPKQQQWPPQQQQGQMPFQQVTQQYGQNLQNNNTQPYGQNQQNNNTQPYGQNQGNNQNQGQQQNNQPKRKVGFNYSHFNHSYDGILNNKCSSKLFRLSCGHQVCLESMKAFLELKFDMRGGNDLFMNGAQTFKIFCPFKLPPQQSDDNYEFVYEWGNAPRTCDHILTDQDLQQFRDINILENFDFIPK